MLKLIKDHNYLNGFVFSFLDYFVVICILTPFDIYYFLHGRWLFSMIATGIILNCVTISSIALRSIIKREQGIGINKIYRDKELLKKVQHEYPNLSRDTMILTVTVLIPYWIFGQVILEIATHNK